jgi:hypothetical protein
MAIACLRLLTFFPLRPDFNLPRLNSCISSRTLFSAFGLYLRPEDFLADVRDLLDFFAVERDVPRCDALALLREEPELLRAVRLRSPDELDRLEEDLRAVAI